MSLDIVVFNRAGLQDGHQIQAADLPWSDTMQLAVAGTYTVPASLPNVILEFTANGASHTFHCGDAVNQKVLASGQSVIYTGRAGLAITVTA